MKMNRMAETWLAAGLALWAAAGCERVPADVAVLREGERLELKGDWSGAEEKYTEACAAGNGEAYRKLGELLVNHEGSRLFLEPNRDAQWLARAESLLERVEMVSSQAESRGFPVEGAEKTLASYRKTVEETRQRLEKERAAAEEAERARQEAERVRLEEERREAAARAAAEERRRAEEAAAAAKRAEEQRRRNSADYCIENGLVLTRDAFREVCRAMNYSQDTGNTIVDDEAHSRELARFKGKRVRLSGSITKVDSKFFGGVKILLNVYGENVWANFPAMPESEGANYRVGQTLTVEGKVESAPINQFNLGSCNIID